MKISLISTHGDVHYIGLNGIEIYDQKGTPIIESKQNIPLIAAKPSSVIKN